jgi:hypothetical protein
MICAALEAMGCSIALPLREPNFAGFAMVADPQGRATLLIDLPKCISLNVALSPIEDEYNCFAY